MRRVATIEEQLLRNRRVTASGCWEWTAALSAGGYGKLCVGSRAGGATRKQVYAHRAAWELWRGPIPEGMEPDHLCRNRACFNPDHLEPVTRRENIRRGAGPALLGALNASKTHCKNGHPFDHKNTYQRPSGGRACRACERARREAA